MKKAALLLFSFFVLTSFSVSTKTEDFDFVGKWTGTDESGTAGGFIFDKDGFATMIKGDKVMGGREFDVQGMRASMRYSINQAADPIELNLLVELKGTDFMQNMLFAVKVIDANHIKVAVQEDGARPKSFTKDNSMVLTRE